MSYISRWLLLLPVIWQISNLEAILYFPAFMAPEAHLEATQPMNQEDLKRADIWSFAMIVYCLMNPDVDHPYEHCLSPDGKKRID